MSNVIDFLESLGQDARLRHAGSEDLNLALTRTQIAPELRAALFGEDQRQLEKLLGVSTNVCCLVHAPEDDTEDDTEDGEEKQDDSDEDDDGDDQDGNSKSQQSPLWVAAAP